MSVSGGERCGVGCRVDNCLGICFIFLIEDGGWTSNGVRCRVDNCLGVCLTFLICGGEWLAIGEERDGGGCFSARNEIHF